MDAGLTPTILGELRDQLEQKRRHLTGEIASERRTEGAEATPEADASTEPEGDLGDVSADHEAWDVGHQALLDQQASLLEVEHALSKFPLGTYGLCERCGKAIPLARLRSLPEARYDLRHQDKAEAQWGDAAGPRDAE